jgi:hypothetical protein
MNDASFSEAELRRLRPLHITARNVQFYLKLQLLWPRLQSRNSCLVWNQHFRTLSIIARHRCLYKVRRMQSTDLLLTANFNHPPTYASPSPSNSDNQNAVTLLVSPTRATRPAQLIHNLFTTKFHTPRNHDL